ncbi:hypothetical protein ACTFIU_011188 [Dictyostelium citrinum]
MTFNGFLNVAFIRVQRDVVMPNSGSLPSRLKIPLGFTPKPHDLYTMLVGHSESRLDVSSIASCVLNHIACIEIFLKISRMHYFSQRKRRMSITPALYNDFKVFDLVDCVTLSYWNNGGILHQFKPYLKTFDF